MLTPPSVVGRDSDCANCSLNARFVPYTDPMESAATNGAPLAADCATKSEPIPCAHAPAVVRGQRVGNSASACWYPANFRHGYHSTAATGRARVAQFQSSNCCGDGMIRPGGQPEHEYP